MRGLSGNALGSLYRFITAPCGKFGLAGSGAVISYFGLQILSYKYVPSSIVLPRDDSPTDTVVTFRSAGKIHITAAILMLLAGHLNIIGAFIPGVASLAGTDPYSGDSGEYPGGPPGMGDDDMYGGPGGMPPGGGDPDAPDPYDGKNPDDPLGEAYDGTEGVGASAPPPGAIAGDQSQAPGQTFGVPPNGQPPLAGYGQTNAENNPNLIAASHGASSVAPSGHGTNEVVFDPATGQWATVFRPSAQAAPATAPQTLAPAMSQPMMPQMAMTAPSMMPTTVGYDMFGRPIMAPAVAPPPQIMPAWSAPAIPPTLLGQQMPQAPPPAVIEDPSAKKREAKKAARKEARKQYERLRADEEEAARQAEEDEARREERKELKREREYAKQIRKQEQAAQEVAKREAEEDARFRKMREDAEDEAKRRKSNQLLVEKRAQAIADARRQAMDRERAVREAEQQAHVHAEQQRAQMHAQALAAAQEAARLHPGPLTSSQHSPFQPSPSHDTYRSRDYDPNDRASRMTYGSEAYSRASSIPTVAMETRPNSYLDPNLLTEAAGGRSLSRDPSMYALSSRSRTPSTRQRLPDAYVPPVPPMPTTHRQADERSMASRYPASYRPASPSNETSFSARPPTARQLPAVKHADAPPSPAASTTFSARAPTTFTANQEARASRALLNSEMAAERKRVLQQQAFERNRDASNGSMPPYGQQRYSKPLLMPSAPGPYVPPDIDALAAEEIDFKAASIRSQSDDNTSASSRSKQRQLYPPLQRSVGGSTAGSVRSGFSGWNAYDQYDANGYR